MGIDRSREFIYIQQKERIVWEVKNIPEHACRERNG